MGDAYTTFEIYQLCPMCGALVPPGTGTLVVEHSKGRNDSCSWRASYTTYWCDRCSEILPPDTGAEP